MVRTRFTTAIVIAVLASARTWAGINQWTPVGPTGGKVTGLALDPSVPDRVFATTSGGFFRSTDGGFSWAASNDGLRDAHLQSVVVAGGTVYVAGDDGVSRSDDQGLHFRRLSRAPTAATALAAGPGASPALFAAGVFAGAWRSDDAGTAWTAINEGLENNQPHPAAVIHAFLVHPRRPNLLWAGSEFGIYRSTDGGGHWALASAPFAGFVTSLALDTGGTLYAGCYVDPAFTAPLPPALFVSHDLGLTWHPAVHLLAARGVTALLADPSGAVWAGTQGAGVFRTTNHGRSWSPVRTGIEGQTIGALVQAPLQPSFLLAGSGLSLNGVGSQEGPGVFRTASSGTSWALTSRGLAATTILAVAADPAAQGQLSAADPYQGVFRTRSGGVAWRFLNRGLPPSASVTQVEADTVSPATVYAAATANDVSALYKHSADPTAPWQLLSSVPAGCSGPLTAGPHGQLFVGGFGDQGGFVCSSEDAGATWKVGSVGLIVVESIAIAPSNPSRVYASGLVPSHAPPGPTFLRSDDGGVTWTGESSVATIALHGLAVDPSDANVVYAASGAVQRSRDGGVTWETLVGGASATLVAVAPGAPNTIYAATGLPGSSFTPPPTLPRVIVSDDGGATWQPLVDGLPPNISALDLAFDPVDSSVVYAATGGGGVLVLQREP